MEKWKKKLYWLYYPKRIMQIKTKCKKANKIYIWDVLGLFRFLSVDFNNNTFPCVDFCRYIFKWPGFDHNPDVMSHLYQLIGRRGRLSAISKSMQPSAMGYFWRKDVTIGHLVDNSLVNFSDSIRRSRMSLKIVALFLLLPNRLAFMYSNSSFHHNFAIWALCCTASI